MSNQIDSEFIKAQYRSGIDNYIRLTKNLGLWASETYVIEKYFNQKDKILDLGCGTGRTTFALAKAGYTDVVGVDLTYEMIAEARKLNEYFDSSIEFLVGDACELKFEQAHFKAVLFSFTGLMSIPGQQNRNAALKEIHRILKPGGVFIFTTYDREASEQYLEFWKDEKERWKQGKQNKKLHDFGDIISKSKNESEEVFIHIPSKKEILTWLDDYGFDCLEAFMRSERFDESEEVVESSGDCLFFVATKR